MFASLTALVAAGCVGSSASASGWGLVSPPASPTGTPAAWVSESAPAPSATDTAFPTDLAPAAESTAPTAAPTADVTVAPTAVVDPLPKVLQAPSGTWKDVHWTALPATPTYGAFGSVEGSTFQVFGWSHGYLGFTISPNQAPADTADPIADPTVVSSYSADGVHWHAGKKLARATVGTRSYLQVMRSVLEGPAGLLAVGWTGGCASENLDSLWTSTDGIAWQPVDLIKAFGGHSGSITHVSGGAGGYVAVAYRSAGAWTSTDGRSWKRVSLDTAPFADSLVNDGTAVLGGFVLAGTAGTADCGVSISDGSTPAPVFRTAAVWWSADSASWTRVLLPGAVARSEYQDTWVCRLSDRAMLVVNDIYGAKRSAWASNDGVTWTATNLPEDVGMRDVVSAGQRNLIVQPVQDTNAPGPLRLRTIDDRFDVVTIDQGGDVPNLVYANGGMGTYGMVALGPTGIVVTNADGSHLWFGTPSAG